MVLADEESIKLGGQQITKYKEREAGYYGQTYKGRRNGNIYKSVQSFKLRLVSHVFQSSLRHLIVRGTCISKEDEWLVQCPGRFWA